MITPIVIPSQVWVNLSESDQEEVKDFITKQDPTRGAYLHIKTPNKGLWYCLISNVAKYEFVKLNPHLTVKDLEDLLAWSSTYLDSYHATFHEDPKIAKAEQVSNLAFAMLQNQKMTADFASVLFETIIEQLLIEGCENREEAIDLLGYVAFDRWSPQQYNNEVRQTLRDLFLSVASRYAKKIKLKKNDK